MTGKTQNLDPMWKILLKDVDLGEPTSFLDHVYLGCTQRECKTREDIANNYRDLFESRMSAWSEKLLYSEESEANISSRSYHMEGYAKKCVERYCELANKSIQQLHKVVTPCIDNHQFKEENRICWRIVISVRSNCLEMPVFGTHWLTRHSMDSKQTCTSSHQMDQSF